jgi:hypothetical protein
LAVGDTALTLRVTVPAVRLRPASSGGRRCQRATLAGPEEAPAAVADAASLPRTGWLIGLPRPGGATLEVLEDQAEHLVVSGLCPLSATDGARTPPVPVRLEDAGWLRDRPVARLSISPLERIGPDAVRIHRRWTLRVRFTGDAAVSGGTAPASEDPPFDHLAARALLNGRALPPLLASKPRPPLAPAAPVDLAADPTALKLVVDADGPVALTGAELAAAGWDLAAVQPEELALQTGGRPQALALYGTADGRLDPDDSLTFPGRAMSGEYTRQNVYWLHRGGGVRFDQRDAAPDGTAPPATGYTATRHFEQDTLYDMTLPLGPGGDRWLWGSRLNAGEERAEELVVPNAAAAAAAGLTVRLQGFTEDARVDPDHHVRLRLNGELVYDGTFDRQGAHDLVAVAPPGTLRAGANRLVVHNVGDTGAFADALYLNWIEVSYAATYDAGGDRLDFGPPAAGRYTFTVRGFARPEVTVLDVTEPHQPVRLAGARITAEGGGYAVTFQDLSGAQTRYVAYSPAGVRRPARIEPNHPSRWRAPNQGADVIIVTHPSLEGALPPLIAHRAGRGLRVAVARIDDVYDEFSDGVFDPRAIRSFLQHATAAWTRPAPAYVLLVGDANLDYRGGYGNGPPNLVPSMQVELDAGGAVTSDTWFAALDDDVLPDVLLGRLSVSTPQQLAGVVDKIRRYEGQAPGGGWRQRAIMVVDDDDAAAFEPASERLIARLPATTAVRRFYAARFPRDRDLTADLRAAIEEGALAVNYIGHGHVHMWSSWPGGGSMFQNGDIAALGNRELPVLTTATCLNGWFSHPLLPLSMAELWLIQPTGGGIAAWSPAGLTTLPAQERMLEAFYSGLADERHLPLGALAAAAAANAYGTSAEAADLIRMFVLLGDPATVVTGTTGDRLFLPAVSKLARATP